MISRRFKFFLLLIFLFTTALVVVLQYNANKNIDELVAGNESLLAEFQMKTRLQDLRNDLLSIDNNVRSSIITNDEAKRTGIEEEVARVKASVKELGDLLVTDSSRRLWDELNVLTDEKIRFSYKVLDTLSGSGKQAAEDFINERKGVQLSEAIERISTRLDGMRQTYLTQIIRETDANSIKAKRLGLIMGLLAVVIVMFTFWYIINRIRKQQEMIAQLNESEKKVRETAQVKEHFIANMSHEIRTPMNAILGFTNLLQKQPLANLPKQYVQSIQSSGETLLNIINDVLDLSKIESGMMRIEKTPLSIRGLTHSVYHLFASKAEEKKLKFTLNVADNIPDTLIGDAVRITQLLVNLVSNAIKFTDKGFVTINITANDIIEEHLQLTIVVSDSGIGIHKSQQQQVFERFTQAEENTTRRFGGTGLGLSIVQQIVTLLYGSILIESEPQKGSSFIITIPFEIAKEQAVEKPRLLETQNLQHIPAINLLVVEDNPMNQSLIYHLLTEWQMHFDIAPNGKAAINALRQKKYDLVLMDIQMPEMDGYTATAFIRNELKLELPIIAMTAHAFAGEREKCISYGMTDYIPKPVRENDLHRLISELTKQHLNNDVVITEPSKVNGRVALKHINLAYLHELSGGNSIFERNILEQFIIQAPEELSNLETAYDKDNWKQFRATAHTLKTTISFLGLEQLLSTNLETLENYSGNETNEQQITSILNEVITVCNNALEEAKEILLSLQ
jgi:signal transduction histidine kinase/CheY-like chemotaxis protein/HPt (histidine-containing phosphotransfer) domain-containing protein